MELGLETPSQPKGNASNSGRRHEIPGVERNSGCLSGPAILAFPEWGSDMNQAVQDVRTSQPLFRNAPSAFHLEKEIPGGNRGGVRSVSPFRSRVRPP